tara:strand:+ start:311 stop:532 length:222 start_codon:yes stop_codon:yes gene_type:complete
MSLQFESLSLDDDSFSQELVTTFDGNDFELRPIKNSRRKGSKAIANAKKRIKKARSRVKKAQTNLRKVSRRIR